MEGQRNFIEGGNHSALDVGVLKKGTRSFEVGQSAKRRAEVVSLPNNILYE